MLCFLLLYIRTDLFSATRLWDSARHRAASSDRRPFVLISPPCFRIWLRISQTQEASPSLSSLVSRTPFFPFSPPQQKVHCSSAESLTKLNPQQQYPTCVINTIKTAGAALTKLADIRKKLSLHPVRYISGAHHVLFILETLTVTGCQVTKRPSYIYLKADMYPES